MDDLQNIQSKIYEDFMFQRLLVYKSTDLS